MVLILHANEKFNTYTSYLKGLGMCVEAVIILMEAIHCLAPSWHPEAQVLSRLSETILHVLLLKSCIMVTTMHLHRSIKECVSFNQEDNLFQPMGHLPMEMILYVNCPNPIKGMSQPTFGLF